MNPRSAATDERTSVPRSMTLAMRSRPWDSLMLSTFVSIDGNVLRTPFDSTPGVKGVYFFGSKVSVCAIPPAIQRTMTVSAVG